MHPADALRAEDLVTDRQRHRHRLVRRIPPRTDILQILPGGIPGFPDEIQETEIVSGFQRLHFFFRPGRFTDEMHGPEKCPVSALLPDFPGLIQQIPHNNIPENRFSEEVRHLLHLPGNRGEILGQISMGPAGRCNRHRIGHFPGIRLNPVNLRFLRIEKVETTKTAHRTGQLIHQSAGFPEIHILRKLTDFRQFRR